MVTYFVFLVFKNVNIPTLQYPAYHNYYTQFYPHLLQYRNLYDHEVTTWSPQGRIHQIEYAMEAVKQGSATVGMKNATHAVLVALKVIFSICLLFLRQFNISCVVLFIFAQRAPSSLSSYQKKIFMIDEHLGVSIAGLTADAQLLWFA